MILLIKQKARFYRRFELDIWGLCYYDSKAKEENNSYYKSWYIRFFLKMYKKKIELFWKRRRRYIYRIDIIEIMERKKKYNKRWVSIRLTRLYFLTLQNYQFRQLFAIARRLTGDLEANYCYLLECRLLPLFYRTNFMSDLFLIIIFIKSHFVFINFKPLSFVNAKVNLGALITFCPTKCELLYKTLRKKLYLVAMLFNPPLFLFMCYRFRFGLLLRKPRKKDLVYPIFIDIQRISGYY